MKRLAIAILLIATATAPLFAKVNIIPKPVSVSELQGEFVLKPSTVIVAPDSLAPLADFLENTLSASTGWDFKIASSAPDRAICLRIDPALVSAPEGYFLKVTPEGVTVVGADHPGLFYGIQSFLQLLPPRIFSDRRVKDEKWVAPAVEITDAPQRPWRGMMLDVARYFHDKDYVKHFIDMMAMYKLNKLQFHLIDDSGWRLESLKYTELTRRGAYAGKDADRLGGFYTRDDIREIIDYAALRGVEIIPEIEFPAHILSAIVAYPWLSCTGVRHELPKQHFISPDLLCVGKDSSIQFLADILDETVELFPSRYINIGGDEAVYTRWEECPDCQSLMKRQGLTKASELQGWLTDTVAKMMAEKGRTVIGWEEIITRGDVSTPVVALIWHDVNDSTLVIPGGHKAILTPATHTYLDFPESSTPGEVKAATWMPPISLEKTYSMPVNDFSDQSSVIGVQGCLWSDQFIHGTVLQEITPLDENRSEQYMDYLAFPRTMAVAEVAWGRQDDRDWQDFRSRVASHFPALKAKGINYRVPEPALISSVANDDGSWTITLLPTVEGADIIYTLDGSYPDVHSAVLSGNVITVPDITLFRASTRDGKRISLPLIPATE